MDFLLAYLELFVQTIKNVTECSGMKADHFRTTWTRLGLHQERFVTTSINAQHYPETVQKCRGSMYQIYFHSRKFHHGGQTKTGSYTAANKHKTSSRSID